MTAATALRALLVDDEPLARQRMRRLLAAHPDVSIVGEAGDIDTATRLVAALEPSVLFLDVSMPGGDGFVLLEQLDTDPPPFVIFVTAHAANAVRAFDARATDFLVKPVAAERLAESVSRARDAARMRAAAAPGAWEQEIRRVLARLGGQSDAPPADASVPARGVARDGGAPTPLRQFTVTVGRRTRFVSADEVDWIEADGNYVRVHCGPETHLVRMTMRTLEPALDPDRFVRIHRSTIVRRAHVQEAITMGPGMHRVRLRDGTMLEVARRYWAALRGAR